MIVSLPGGETVEIGATEVTPTVGIVDRSRRVTDDFGVTTVVKRGFSRTLSCRVALPTDQVDGVARRLAALRATTALWIADDEIAWLNVDGFYTDFDIDLAVPPVSFCTLNVEGLTEVEPGIDPGGDPAPDDQPSTLLLLRPLTIDDSRLLSSTVPENDAAAWAAGATYGLGSRVMRAHRVFESLTAPNVGNEPTSTPGAWLDTGPTNRWAMFDQALGTSTAVPEPITVTLPAGQVDAIALLDVVGASVRVQAQRVEPPHYDRTVAADGGAIVFHDLLGIPGGNTVTVTIAGPGTVSVGTLLAGDLVPLGVTERSPTAGIIDFSRKDVDDFGEVTIVRRSFSKKMAVRALIRTDAFDIVANRIAGVRALPCLWIGQVGQDVLSVYGFFRDFSIEAGRSVSKLALTIEGLSTAPKVLPAPSTVAEGSVDGEGWHLGLLPGDVFMRISNDGGVTFGPAVRILGEDGQNGAYQQFIFKRSPALPDTPTGGGVPFGWYDGVPPDGPNPIWWTVQYQRDGVALGPWSTPARHTGEPGLNAPLVATQWSVDGVAAWHFDFADGDLYQRQSNDNGATWGPAYRVIGESVEGADGTSPSIVFRRALIVPPTPATSSGNPPPGWSDGPPGGSGFLWQTNATFRGPAQLTAWSPPIRIDGEAARPFPMVARGAAIINGDRIGKGPLGAGSTYDSDVYGSVPYRGGCFLSFRPSQLVQSLLVGLSADPSVDQSYDAMAGAWHCSGNGKCYSYIGAVSRIDAGAYTTGTILSIAYVNGDIVWFKDAVEIDRITAGPNLQFYFDSTFYQPNVYVQDVQWLARANDGKNALVGFLTNEAHNVPADAAGNPITYSGTSGQFKVLLGTVDVTAQCAFGVETTSIISATINSAGAYGLTGFPTGSSSGYAVFRATYPGYPPIDRTFSVTKNNAGANGAPAVDIDLSASADFIKYSKSDAIITGDLHVTTARKNTTEAPTFVIETLSGSTHHLGTAAALVAARPDLFYSTGPDNLSIVQARIAEVTAYQGDNGFRVRAGVAGAEDRKTFYKVKDGADGASAPLVRTQWSINGVDGWHDNYFGADVYQRQSNDNGATWGPAYRVIGEGGQAGADGTSPEVVFRRSASVPPAPIDNSGNPPSGWSDGPPAGTDFLWQSKAKFRATTQLTSWSTPQRISGENGANAVVMSLAANTVTIAASSAGVTRAGALPRAVAVTVKSGPTDVTAGTAFNVTTSDGTLINANYANGAISITRADVEGFVTVTGIYGGATLGSQKIQIIRNLDAPPPASSTGGSVDISLAVFSLQYNPGDASNRNVTLQASASGQLRAYSTGEYYPDSETSPSSFGVGMKLQYRPAAGGAWNDFGAENQGSFAQYVANETIVGNISIDQTITGMASGGFYEVRGIFRKVGGSTPIGVLIGSLTAVQP